MERQGYTGTFWKGLLIPLLGLLVPFWGHLEALGLDRLLLRPFVPAHHPVPSLECSTSLFAVGFVHLLAAVTLSFPNQGTCTKAMPLLIFGQFVLNSFVTNKMLKQLLPVTGLVNCRGGGALGLGPAASRANLRRAGSTDWGEGGTSAPWTCAYRGGQDPQGPLR